MQRLFTMARQVEDPEARRDVLGALQAAGVPAHLVNAARLAPRLGEALAARLAVELGTDTRAFQLTPTETRDIRTVAGDVWRGSDRLGGLRAAQAAATGNAAFATIGAAEEQQLQQVATVRGAPGRTLSSGTAREIYAQLYGGVQVVNRPGDQVLAVVPAGTDPDRLARGLNQLLEARLAALRERDGYGGLGLGSRGHEVADGLDDASDERDARRLLPTPQGCTVPAWPGPSQCGSGQLCCVD
jgi:hypothetical protein